MAGEYLEKYTYEYLLAQALAQVPDTLDKREGSVIYDAIAPACYELSEMYMQLRQIVQQTYVSTASGQYLDLRVQEQGLSRYAATYAVKKAAFTNASGNPVNIPIGSRFSTIADADSINYEVTAEYLDESGDAVPGAYQLTCETLGTSGNAYTGNLLPITYISGLATAIMSDIIIPARDEETDEELLIRYLAKANQKSFGGNIAQYDEMMKSIDGVGEVQVYPVWNGGGTVKLSVIDAEYNPVTNDFITALQLEVDPENAVGQQGTGLGRAPIGHKVTIVAPTAVTINVTATLALKPGYTLISVQTPIEEAIDAYLLEIRQQWGLSDELNNYSSAVYLARVTAAMLSVAGILNVTNTKLNGSAADIILTEDVITQELPLLGTVILSE
jgi:uncharacterized phage protein gp47/JayE